MFYFSERADAELVRDLDGVENLYGSKQIKNNAPHSDVSDSVSSNSSVSAFSSVLFFGKKNKNQG